MELFEFVCMKNIEEQTSERENKVFGNKLKVVVNEEGSTRKGWEQRKMRRWWWDYNQHYSISI